MSEFQPGDKVSLTHHYDEVTGTVEYYSVPQDLVRIVIPTPGGQTETITRHVSNHGLTLVGESQNDSPAQRVEAAQQATEELPFVEEPEPPEAA